MSWLESRIAVPAAPSSATSARSSSTPAGSRPLAGSSRMSRLGDRISAAARPSRWRIPVERPPARRFAAAASPARSRASSIRAPAFAPVQLRKQLEISANREVGIEPRLLDEAGNAGREARIVAVEPRSEQADGAGVRPGEAEEQPEKRRLAGAVSPDESADLAAPQVEVDPVDRLDLAEALAQPARLDGGRRGRGAHSGNLGASFVSKC